MDIKLVGMEDETFYRMVEEAMSRIMKKVDAKAEKWIGGEEVMKILRISSRTTLQKLRDENKIRYSQPEKKIILYDRDSIMEYIENHAKNTF